MKNNPGIKATDLYEIRKAVRELQTTSELLISRGFRAPSLDTALQMRELATKLTEAAVLLSEKASAVLWDADEQVNRLVDNQ